MYNISYVSTNPNEGDSPKVTILSNQYDQYKVKFTNTKTNEISEITTTPGKTVIAGKQYYIPWKIDISHEEETLYGETLNLEGKVVFIKFDASALGDNIAWIPYVEEFRQKHNCHVICSTFYNNLFNYAYPNIMFVKPNTRIDNVYAQYYIGTNDKSNPSYQPSSYLDNPLQKVASDILGLDYKEIPAKINLPNKKIERNPKKVCISPYASHRIKEWNVPGGWQTIIDYLKLQNYEVYCISKEPSFFNNCINKTGDIPLEDRVEDLLSSQFFIGVSSGLSWLSWAVGTNTVLISDITPAYHEFQTNVIRICNNTRKSIAYREIEHPSTISDVLRGITYLIKSYSETQ